MIWLVSTQFPTIELGTERCKNSSDMENCDENLGAFGAIFFLILRSRANSDHFEFARMLVGRSLRFELMHKDNSSSYLKTSRFFSGNTFVRVLYLEVVKICYIY